MNPDRLKLTPSSPRATRQSPSPPSGVSGPADARAGACEPSAPPANPHDDVFLHSHNDYDRAHPIDDALAAHADSLEVDVHMQNQVRWRWPGLSRLAHGDLGFRREPALLVGHGSLEATLHHDTLEDLYLKPLQQKIDAAGGQLPDGPLTLMIDLKSEKRDGDKMSAWKNIAPVLERYRSMLTRYENGREISGAVNVVISGTTPEVRNAIAQAPTRYTAIDGTLGDLDHSPSPTLTPQVSARWSDVFHWNGKGPMPEAERERLRDLTAKGNAQGIRVRFWEAPDNPQAWCELVDAGAEVNTDQPQAFARWLEQRQGAAGS